MVAYLARRLGLTVVVLLLALVLLSLLTQLVPGDPVKSYYGPLSNDALVQSVRHEMHLDEPGYEQVALTLWSYAHGDLGLDFRDRTPVLSLIEEALPHTLILAVTGLLLGTLLGVPLGILCAAYPNSWLDRLLAAISVSMVTAPVFVTAFAALLVFSVRLQWFPATGSGDLSDPLDYARHLVLPAAALAVGWIGYLARLVRASLLEVLSTSYVQTARAFGISEWRIFAKFALKNALIPIVAVLGLGLGYTIAGTVFIENIFARQGLGRVALEAFGERNWPVIRGTVAVFAVFFVLANLLADLSYHLLNPRIRRGTR